MFRAYILLRTQGGISREIIDNLRKNHGEIFVHGTPVYGWYDALVEFEIPYVEKLNEIIEDLVQNHLDIAHIGTIVEKTSGAPAFSLCTTTTK